MKEKMCNKRENRVKKLRNNDTFIIHKYQESRNLQPNAHAVYAQICITRKRDSQIYGSISWQCLCELLVFAYPMEWSNISDTNQFLSIAHITSSADSFLSKCRI